MSKILITGSTGMLGSSLVPYLRKCKYEVVTHSLNSIANSDYAFNLNDCSTTSEFLKRIAPSVIVNLVSLTSVEQCEQDLNLAYSINSGTVENIVSWIEASKHNCYLVHISTDHLYDGVGLSDENQLNIVNNYAMTKRAGELAALRIPGVILRTNFVGRSGTEKRESLTDWVYTSIKSGKTVEVLNDVYFSPLSISSLVEMIEVVLQQKPNGIFNLGSHNGMSKAEFDFAFAECLNLPTRTMKKIETCEATFLRAKRPKNMCMNIAKFENALGLKLPSLTDLIDEIAEEYYEK